MEQYDAKGRLIPPKPETRNLFTVTQQVLESLGPISIYNNNN